MTESRLNVIKIRTTNKKLKGKKRKLSLISRNGWVTCNRPLTSSWSATSISRGRLKSHQLVSLLALDASSLGPLKQSETVLAACTQSFQNVSSVKTALKMDYNQIKDRLKIYFEIVLLAVMSHQRIIGRHRRSPQLPRCFGFFFSIFQLIVLFLGPPPFLFWGWLSLLLSVMSTTAVGSGGDPKQS